MTTRTPLAFPKYSDLSHSYNLPFELEQDICEIAASEFPTSIPNIVLVARQFRIWFEPRLYRIIRSGEDCVIPPLYLSTELSDENTDGCEVLNIPRIRKFGRHVQHVLLQKRSTQEIARILECCPNVTNLALWIIRGPCAPLIPILEKLPLKRLSLDPSAFFPTYSLRRRDPTIPFNQPMFLGITHIQLINARPPWSKWKQLALMPKLTHLALTRIVDQDFIDRALEECTKLELLIMVGESIFTQEDDRLVLLQSNMLGVGTMMDHWEEGASGEDDLWTIAQRQKEKAMEARRTNGLSLI